jgi:hypothetical protein
VFTPSFAPPGDPGQVLPGGSPWSVLIFTVKGVAFTTHVDFFDGNGAPAPLSTNKAVALTLVEVAGPNPGATLGSVLVPAGATSVDVTGSTIGSKFLGAQVQAVVGKGQQIMTDLSDTFEVFQAAAAASGHKLLSVGGDNSGVDSSCIATKQQPTCVDVVLPAANAVIGNLVVSLGSCAGICGNQALLTGEQLFEVNTAAGVVTRTTPIVVLFKCDKSQCPGDPKQYHFQVRLTPADDWTDPPICARSGEVGPPPEKYCWDQQSSIKNGAGDLSQVLLFLVDAKVAMPR